MGQRPRKSSILQPETTRSKFINFASSISSLSSLSSLSRRVRWRRYLVLAVWGLICLWMFRAGFQSEGLPSSFGRTGRIGNRPTVQLRQGKIIGFRVKKGYPQAIEQFLGIPYAQSTAGQRRFRPPSPIHTSIDDFDASTYGERCPSGADDDLPQGENCLNLNIYRPRSRDVKKKIPVLVHFHGGSFNSGRGSDRNIANLVAFATEPFIGISFNYRLGAFGFLSGKLMAKEGSLNLGLKDQQMLLQWVQENVSEFGGDPGNVTIMGTSAGAHSVGHHMLLNTAKAPLFNKVIMESGAPTARAVYSSNHPLNQMHFRDFLVKLGVEDSPQDKIMGVLRSLTFEEIKKASEAVFADYESSLRWPFQPVIDGQGGMIPIAPIEAWKAGEHHRVPILTGYTTNEGASFVPSSAATSKSFTDFFHTLLPQLSHSALSALAQLYPDPLTDPTSPYIETPLGTEAQFSRLAAAYGHFAYIAPVVHTAYLATSADLSAPPPVYLYNYAVNTKEKGAVHTCNLHFVTYDEELRKISPTIKDLAGITHAYWTSFILTGDPNAVPGRYKDRKAWDRFSSKMEQESVLVFGEGNDEMIGGKNKGVLADVGDLKSLKQQVKWWHDRVDLFET